MAYIKQGASKIVKAIDGDDMQDELNRVINKIADAILNRDKEIEKRIIAVKSLPDGLDKYAELAELNIIRREIKSTKLEVYKILRTSTNKLLIAAMDEGEN